MTEAEWLNNIQPLDKLKFLKATASDRKLRLYAVACCRRIWHLYGNLNSSQAVEVAELWIEGACSPEDVIASDDAALAVYREADRDKREIAKRIDGRFLRDRYPSYVAARRAAAVARTALNLFAVAFDAAYETSKCCRDAAGDVSSLSLWPISSDDNPEGAAQDQLIREIFGNPFHPTIHEPYWLTPAVIKSADAIYYERAFDCLPVLAEELETAGCTNAEMLDHCRGPGPHVRGCWMVDLLLGKK